MARGVPVRFDFWRLFWYNTWFRDVAGEEGMWVGVPSFWAEIC
jgi:hypothetical protein